MVVPPRRYRSGTAFFFEKFKTLPKQLIFQVFKHGYALLSLIQMFFHVGAIFWSTTWPKSRVLKTRNFTKNLAQSTRKTWIFQVLSLKAILDNFCKIMVKFVVFWLFEAVKYVFKTNLVSERQFPEFYSTRRYRYGTALAVAVPPPLPTLFQSQLKKCHNSFTLETWTKNNKK